MTKFNKSNLTKQTSLWKTWQCPVKIVLRFCLPICFAQPIHEINYGTLQG